MTVKKINQTDNALISNKQDSSFELQVNLINRNDLSEEYYFTSLLEKASSFGLLSETQIQKIQFECLNLLAFKTEQYSGGFSSSIKINLANSIMKSTFYTIGLHLKSFDSPDDAIKVLIDKRLSDVYALGKKQIDIKLKSTKHFHTQFINGMINTINVAYSSTLVDGINGFFKLYNPDYGADEIHITADYPLCNPIGNFVGIEFIQKYLKSANCENIFCRYFSDKAIHNLLSGFDLHYSELIFNIFEQVLTTSIGCVLADTDPINLEITYIQMNRLHTLLFGKSREEIYQIIVTAYKELVNQLSLTNSSLQKYIEIALHQITINIHNGIKKEMLERVFIESKHSQINRNIHFSFGEKRFEK